MKKKEQGGDLLELLRGSGGGANWESTFSSPRVIWKGGLRGYAIIDRRVSV